MEASTQLEVTSWTSRKASPSNANKDFARHTAHKAARFSPDDAWIGRPTVLYRSKAVHELRSRIE